MDVADTLADGILVKSRGYLIPNDVVAVDGGIKAVGPAVLKPPPAMKLPPIDLSGSSWDFLTHFAPSETVQRPSSSSSDISCDEEEVETEETGGKFIHLGDTAHEACSIAIDKGDSSSTVSITSSIYASGRSIITSWLKGQVPGRASFSSVSSIDSESTCSFLTPSLEFPDRVSFRKLDLSEAGPSRHVRENRKLTRPKLIEKLYNPEDMVLVTSWLKGQLLGRGSFASVYEAISENGDFLAVKEVSLLDQGRQAKECIKQLEGEIALLSQLQHQNIVRYRGTAKDGSNLYIFLELVTQGSLKKLYERYKLRDSVVSLYTRQILDGLEYLHDKGCVHRDIKCANILVGTNGAIKLADFGLAKVSNDMKSPKGTPFWMAPEVINPKLRNDGYGSPADIWSLGCTVLEMCTGQTPYSDIEPVRALFRIGRGTLPDIPDTLSLDARDFILKCLKVSPAERPTAAELLNHPFVIRPLSRGSAAPHLRRG
ncbi:PREDICTED: mitogen-activated protein kinase kinase kinase 1-like isoform X3 [Camelina sativa]|uniref:mitogen-activated protein kinase kinase kinase n=1 Tax=Camelina sativa TaxID=90675 RepID=A0ABM0V4A2_CAMSA|nr:PREDICTED: mitogen-activated protein kinase kinase kinase 1-like isoform X3 [Camelina sativa]